MLTCTHMSFHPYTFISKVLAVGLSLATLAAFGNQPMESLYDSREAASLTPYVYNVDSTIPPHLFPVPQDNAVGTNDLDNAITILVFQKNRLQTKSYFRNALKDLSGGGQYLPEPLSNHSIGFAQTRRFMIFDFSSNTVKRYGICTSMDDSILHVGIGDAASKRFLFEIEEQNPESEDWRDVAKSLWLMDLSGEKPRLIKRYEKQKGSVWSMFKNQLFFCDFKNIELKVFDSNLKPSHHPVMDVLKKNKGKIDFVDVMPHSTLPFAILSGGEHGAELVYWNQTFRDEQPRNLFSIIDALNFRFSPDGRWVVFQKVSPDPKRSYVMPISEKYPNFLGSPILLDGATFERDHFAWTKSPVNLVGSASGKLLRYDLTKEGHPEAEGYPSYWDYVVEKDLEKLRKAGRQGLRPAQP